MSASNGVTVSGTIANEVEVVAKATRRRFSAEYKLKILREAEACTRLGELGALLRRVKQGLRLELDPVRRSGADERASGSKTSLRSGTRPAGQVRQGQVNRSLRD